MLDVHQCSGLGFMSAKLPHHVSIKQPFKVEDFVELEQYFDDFSSSVHPIRIKLVEIQCVELSIFGIESGLLWFDVEDTEELRTLHNRLNSELSARFRNTQAPHDGERYHFHMTITIGGKPYTSYQDAFNKLKKKRYLLEYVYDEIGLFYYEYDEEQEKLGDYYCYKRKKLE